MAELDNLSDGKEFDIPEEWQEALQIICEKAEERAMKRLEGKYRDGKTSIAITIHIVKSVLKLPRRQQEVLTVSLEMYPDCSLSKVASRLGLKKSTVSEHYDRISKKHPWIKELVKK
jgi:DNA-binding MarR family transcriptional regulator